MNRDRPVTKKWQLRRRKELEALQTLLHKLESLNHGNRFLENVQECIKIAGRLNAFNLNKPRKRFLHFLIAVAAGEEHPEEHKSISS